MQGYLAPPITAVFLLGLFYKRTTAPAAVAGLGIGTLLGLGKLTIQAIYGTGDGKISDPQWLAAIGDFHFLYASGILFAATVVIVVLVSKVTSPESDERIKDLTYESIDKEEIRASWNGWDIAATAFVLLMTFGIYAYFSFWI